MKNTHVPMNLQFFADGEPSVETPKAEEPKVETKVETKDTSAKEEKKEPDIQELMNEIARQKRAIDKLTHENSDLTKKYRATLSEQEVASIEKAEAQAKQEEYIKNLVRENNINKLEKSYLGMGYTSDEAARIAVAEADNDFETRMKIMNEVDARKAKEHEAKWLAERPQINSGTEGKEPADFFIQGLASVPTRFGK
jgi:hypothetical protein